MGGSSTQVETPQTKRPVSRGPGTGSAPVRCLGDLRGGTTTLLPLAYLSYSKTTKGLETDPGRIETERVSEDSFVQNVQSFDAQQVPSGASLDGKSRSEGRLPPRANPKELTQVPGIDMLGEVVFLSGPSLRAGSSSMAVLPPHGAGAGRAEERRNKHPGVHREPGSVEPEQAAAEGARRKDSILPDR